jgi:hypothetical protein
MNRVFLAAVLGIGLVGALFQSSSATVTVSALADYPLVCRGDKSLTIGPVSGVGNIGFTFTRGKTPAGEGLNPGECSWVDRGMSDAEPNSLSQHIEEVIGAPKPRWYEELHSSDSYWTFMVSNNGKGQLIATSARAGRAEPSTITTTFTPPAEGLRTFYVSHKWRNDRFNCENPFAFKADIDDVPEGQVLVGYINDYFGGSGPLPCEWNSKNDYRGTMFFDLSELFKGSPLPLFVADKAILKFKRVEGSVAAYDGARSPMPRVCEDELFVADADSMKGFTDRVTSYSGDTHFPNGELIGRIKDCLAEGCSIDVTGVVNKWISGKLGRYGFVIAGESEDWLDKLIPSDKSVCETRYTDFSLTVNYRSAGRATIPPPPPIDRIPTPGDPGKKLSTRKNVALASNLAKVSASNFTQDDVYPGSHFQPSYAIDGLRYLHLVPPPIDVDGYWRDEHGLPSWIEIEFDGGAKTISEVDVFTVPDSPDYLEQKDPADTLTFKNFGATAFDVQYWDDSAKAWMPVPNASPGGRGKFGPSPPNDKVWRQFGGFKITTSKIRVVVKAAAADKVARIAEVEAWTP